MQALHRRRTSARREGIIIRFMWLLIVLLVGVAGCNSASAPEGRVAARNNLKNNLNSIELAQHNWREDLQPDAHRKQLAERQAMVVAKAQKEQPEAENNAAADPPAVSEPRKIIFTAYIELLVDRLDQAEQQLRQLLKAQDGYIAQSRVTGLPGEPRSGSWTLRVPVARFQSLRDALLGLGEMRENKVDSSDITDEYYDLTARIKNKQQEENRLLELLKKTTANLKDILTVEEHLTRVRGDIEQMQGQLQRWEKETALATLTVVLHDRKDYVPPTKPAFGTTIGRTFSRSVDNLIAFGQNVTLVAVAVSPWLPLLVVVAVPLWWLWRRARRTPAAPPVGTA